MKKKTPQPSLVARIRKGGKYAPATSATAAPSLKGNTRGESCQKRKKERKERVLTDGLIHWEKAEKIDGQAKRETIRTRS